MCRMLAILETVCQWIGGDKELRKSGNVEFRMRQSIIEKALYSQSKRTVDILKLLGPYLKEAECSEHERYLKAREVQSILDKYLHCTSKFNVNVGKYIEMLQKKRGLVNNHEKMVIKEVVDTSLQIPDSFMMLERSIVTRCIGNSEQYVAECAESIMQFRLDYQDVLKDLLHAIQEIVSFIPLDESANNKVLVYSEEFEDLQQLIAGLGENIFVSDSDED